MKKVKIMSFLVLSLFLILYSTVFASEPQISMGGNEVAKPNETKNTVVSVSNEDIGIGVVSGTIEKTSNITSISVSGKNSWNLTYNEETGAFNIYKASGAKSEEIMNIEYTVSGEEGTAQIVLKGVKMTTIEYETKEIGDITKVITIKNQDIGADNTNNSVGTENTNNTTNSANTNSLKNNNTNKNNTTSKNKIPQTGGISFTVIILAIMIVLSIISYRRYIKYKNV